jgi:hypothetical protein
MDAEDMEPLAFIDVVKVEDGALLNDIAIPFLHLHFSEFALIHPRKQASPCKGKDDRNMQNHTKQENTAIDPLQQQATNATYSTILPSRDGSGACRVIHP